MGIERVLIDPGKGAVGATPGICRAYCRAIASLEPGTMMQELALSGRPLDECDSQARTPPTRTNVRMPTVAAIVCNYNQKQFLEDAIASMLAQTYPHMEYVVVDDCSTDGSSEVIEDILSRNRAGGVRFIQHEDNRGQMAAMLSGLDATTAPFVAWLDADDIWFPEYIERHVAHHLNAQVNAAISTSNLALIDRDGMLIAGANPGMSVTNPLRKPGRTCPIRAARLFANGAGIDYATSLADGPVAVRRSYEPWVWSCTSGLVFRRATIEAIVPPEPHKFRTCADHYLARFSHVLGGTIWTGETLGYYRCHDTNHFAKRPIYGDVALGREPDDILAEGNRQFARKLRESGQVLLEVIGQDRPPLLIGIGRNAALAEIVRSGKLLYGLRLKEKMRLLRRYLLETLRRKRN